VVFTGSIEQLKKKFDIEIKWRTFPLHPNTPEEGLTLEQLFAGSPVDVDLIMQNLKKSGRSWFTSG
jgi:predicted DsbA family dithiol-disulfide isomerase